ncbi:MAG: pyridoxal 5'-phosphate synthase glutaminase subunit PdxT [Gammaproteobacteria bacterium]
MKRVGIIAIQGDVQAHARACERVGASVSKILFERDLDDVDAIVIPGGESTTMAKGLTRLELFEPLRERIRRGLPVLGTCAGAILLSERVENHPVPVIGVLDATAMRNAYGTQVDSFASPVDDGCEREFDGMRCVFIRAPQLGALGPQVKVLASVDSKPVFVQQRNVLAATFHPELTGDVRVHEKLLALA